MWLSYLLRDTDKDQLDSGKSHRHESTIGPCYSKCASKSAVSVSSVNLLQMQNLNCHKTKWIKNLNFSKIPNYWCLCPFVFEKTMWVHGEALIHPYANPWLDDGARALCRCGKTKSGSNSSFWAGAQMYQSLYKLPLNLIIGRVLQVTSTWLFSYKYSDLLKILFILSIFTQLWDLYYSASHSFLCNVKFPSQS
jgi:hypothetical protein